MEPRILGGRGGFMLGNVIEDQFTVVFNWPLGGGPLLHPAGDRAADPGGLLSAAAPQSAGPGMSRLWPLALKTYLGLILAFLYLPIAVMIVMAFNQSPLYELPVVWDTIWFEHLVEQRPADRPPAPIPSSCCAGQYGGRDRAGHHGGLRLRPLPVPRQDAAAAPALPAHHHPLAHHRHLHAGAVLLDRHRARACIPCCWAMWRCRCPM